MMPRKTVLVVLLMACVLSLSACGRKNKPIAPDDVEPTYPRTYPAPAPEPKLYK
ncbi:hypothetical protein [Terasakiella pusilla]|jgi:predicted lipoprotein|uniref:hypothetical protein n=1 Tax=Terasakiella pusilla TaxID=64973 RepID=UPI003AA84902